MQFLVPAHTHHLAYPTPILHHIFLQFVGIKRGEIPFLIQIRYRERHIQSGIIFFQAAKLGGIHKDIIRIGNDTVHKRFKELEDTASLILKFAQHPIVHVERDMIVAFRRPAVHLHPLDELLGGERPETAVPVRETERYILAQNTVAQDYLEFGGGVRIEHVRTFPAQHRLGAFGHHTRKAHLRHTLAYLIVIEQMRAGQYRGLLSEHFGQTVAVQFHLLLPQFPVENRRGGTAVIGGQKLHPLAGDEAFEIVEHFRHIPLHLIHRTARKHKRETELVAVFVEQAVEHGVGPIIGALREPLQQILVAVVIVVVVPLPYIEEPIRAEIERVVHLENDTYGIHDIASL